MADLKQNSSGKQKERKHFARNKDKRRSLDKKEIAGAKSRAAAALCVNAIEQGQSLSTSIPHFTKDLDDRDRALVMEIVYGTLRHRRLLSTTVNSLLDYSINQKFNIARALIICAIYQIVFMRAPDHAIVSSTVGACSLCHCSSFKNLVNAVLRRFLREGAHLCHDANICVEQSFPDWMYKKLEEDYKDDAKDILIKSNQHAPMFLRVETNKISREKYLEQLKNAEIEASAVELTDSCIKLSEAVNVEKLPFFKEGYVAVQDLAAQMAAPLLDLRPGMIVIDCCAAPGGKSAHIMSIEPSTDLTVCDIDETRLESAKKELSRLNDNATYKVADMSDEATIIEGEFDRILVDAPCSGTGVIRRHPDIKWLRRKGDIDKLVQTSAKILDNAFKKLKKGGILVFSTCSILKDENIRQAEAFLKRHSDASYLPFNFKGNLVESYQRLPGEDDADGFFYTRFIKN